MPDDTGSNRKWVEECPQAGETRLDELVEDLTSFLRQYVAFRSLDQALAVALWVLHTHVHQHFEVTPYLWIFSAEKQSGKTRLLEVLGLLAREPWPMILPSEAVLYRLIEATQPTILLDEVDAIYGPNAREHEALRGILNAGYRRGMRVPRCAPKTMEVEGFEPFCPKALAGIGSPLPDTVLDRCIPVELRRRSTKESVRQFRTKIADREATPLRECLKSWASEWSPPEAEPTIPAGLSDRAADCWEPLLAIAEAAGADRAKQARYAAVALSGSRNREDRSEGVRLLDDIQGAFNHWGGDRIQTTDLLNHLTLKEESPWGEWNGGRGLSPHGLSRLLRPYGIQPATLRFEHGTAKGYRAADFEDAWARYLPCEPLTPDAAGPPGDGVTDPGPLPEGEEW